MTKSLKRADLPQAMLLADVQDVQAALRISKASIYRLIQQGKLSAPRKLGKRSLWPMSEVQKLVDELGH